METTDDSGRHSNTRVVLGRLARCGLVSLAAIALTAGTGADRPVPQLLKEIIDRANTESEVEVVAHQVRLLRDAEKTAPDLVLALVRAWYRVGRFDDALTTIKRLAGQPQGRGMALLLEAEIQLALGKEPEAIAAFEKAALEPPEDTERSLMDASNTANEARYRLALLREQRGEWDAALACWKVWEPRSWCGTCRSALLDARALGIARSWFWLGDINRGIEDTWAVVSRKNELAHSYGFSPEAVLQFVELCARAGRSVLARERLVEIHFQQEEHLRRVDVAIDIGEGFAAKRPSAILAAVRPLDPEDTEIFPDGSSEVQSEWRMAAQLALDLGEAGRAELENGIARVDVHAIVLAGVSHDARFASALERQVLREGDATAKRIKEALQRLKSR